MQRFTAAFGLVVALASSACAPHAPADLSQSSAPARSPTLEGQNIPPEVQRQDMRGEYIVIFINGASPVINIAGYEPTITIGSERIHFQSQCIYADWTYKQTGEAISTQTYFEPGSAMCARGLAPGETAIQDAFDSLETIRHIRGGLYLEGGGHRLQLQRKVDGAEIASRAVDLAGTWRVTALDGKEIGTPHGLALSADHDQIWWEPECALQYRPYTIDGRRFDAGPVRLSEQAVCDIAFPEELSRIWSALEAANTISKTAANRVLISGGGRGVTLASE